MFEFIIYYIKNISTILYSNTLKDMIGVSDDYYFFYITSYIFAIREKDFVKDIVDYI